MLHILTARYMNRTLHEPGLCEDLVPVCTSNGMPRFKVPYKDKMATAKQLAPDWAVIQAMRSGVLSREEFTQAYRDKLDGLGVRAIRSFLERVVAGCGNPSAVGVVLLCFEDIRDEDGFCHRRIFADWWVEKTGEPVGELHETPWGKDLNEGKGLNVVVKPMSEADKRKAIQRAKDEEMARLQTTFL